MLAAVLALYPWAYAVELVGEHRIVWSLWLIALTCQSLALVLHPTRHRFLPAATLAHVVGLCAMHALIVYERIVTSQLQIDYFVLANWLSAASRGLLEDVPNRPAAGGTYFQYYLDPLVPLVNRLLVLTDNPFRLLTFQTLAVLGAAFILWAIAVRTPRLYAFQALVPTAFLLHPAVVANLQSDYHTSGIGIAFLLLGTYLFFRGRGRVAYALLVLGTLTKVSFWFSWFCFALVQLWRRRWLPAAAYAMTAIVALLVYRAIQPADDARRDFILTMYFGEIARDPAEIPGYLAMHAEDLGSALLARLGFFLGLGGAVGFAFLYFPVGLIPLVPLAGLSLVERTGYRSLLGHQYAAEYLGFLLAGVLLGLLAAPPRWRPLAVASLGIGSLVSVNFLISWGPSTGPYDSTIRQAFSTTVAAKPSYDRAARFSACATGGKPIVVTLSQRELLAWPTFAREPLSDVWIDQVPTGLDFIEAAFQEIEPARWPAFETLVYSANPEALGSLARFPFGNGLRHTEQYARLLERLPFEVTTEHGWRYRGTDRLARCAADGGYEARVAVPATPVRADRLPALATFPCDAEAARLTWWFNRSDLLDSPPEGKAVVERLLQDLEVRSATRDGAEVVCFAKVQAAHAVLDLDWRTENPPPVAPCEVDQLLAQRYLETVTDAELRTRMLQMFNAATVAQARKSQQDCLLATAAIRREFLAFLSSPVPREPLPDIVDRTLALPYRLPAEAVPLVDRFPCVAEADRLAWWNARPQLSASSPDAIRALDRAVTDATVKDPVTCMGEILAATDALNLDWRNDNPPPSASCEADLTLAHAYYDAAFDDALRAATLPLLNGATVANARRDSATCLLGTSAVRRAYYAATGAPPVPDQHIDMPQAAQAPFRIRPDVVPLLDRFPCLAEAARLAWWNDRPELLAPGADRTVVADALRESAVADPIACFARLHAASEALKLDWRPDNPPPVASCEIDLRLAATYHDDVFDDRLRAAVLPFVNDAVLANARQDIERCLLASSAVRRAYVDATGHASAPSAFTPAAVAASLPFRLHPDAVPLLDRFPCQAEVARLAWWTDRAGRTASDPAGADVVTRAFRDAGGKLPIECLVDIQSAAEALKLDWSPANLPPNVLCDADLALAATYHDAVLYGPLVQQARPILERMFAANNAGDTVGCLQHAASVRRVYLDALGYRTSAR